MEQPFYAGQRVVCVNDKNITDPHPVLIEGEIYTVAGIHPCGDVGIKERPTNGKYSQPYFGYFPHRFAPIQTQRISAIPELLKEPVEERVDHHQPIKILTTDG